MTVFLDTNILVYAQQSGTKVDIAKDLVAEGGVISVPVLNELANVLRKKLRREWPDVADVLNDVMAAFDPILPLTARTHVEAIGIARDHGLFFYDALIIASALGAACDTLYSEDLQHGRVFGMLTIRNPFFQSSSER